MNVWTRRSTPALALGLLMVLLLPPVQHALTSTMTTQMLVQIPLLIAVGWWWRGAVPPRIVAIIDAWNQSGITGVVLARSLPMPAIRPGSPRLPRWNSNS